MAPAALQAAAFINIQQYKQALDTANFTLEYEKSDRIVALVTRDEDIRKLKCQILLLQSENDALNDQLASAEESVDNLQHRLDFSENRVDEIELIVQQLNNDIRIRDREYDTTKAELAAMSATSFDSTRNLTEKLSLVRELAVLKPETESLRAQVETNKHHLAEKLALQRHLATVQVELENAQRSTQRALQRAGNNHDQSEIDAQVDELQKKLREAKLARREAETEIDQLKQDLDSERRSTDQSKSNKAKQDDNAANIAQLIREVSDLEREQSQSRLEASKMVSVDQHYRLLQDQMQKLQKDLLDERKERQKIEKSFETENSAWEAKNSLLNNKLDQFRSKLRSTKDRLKEAEDELHSANHPKPSLTNETQKSTSKLLTIRKRTAKNAQVETALGTPGDEPAPKRGKRALSNRKSSLPSVPGDKSHFSITPFLNRTSFSVASATSDADFRVKGSVDETSVEATAAESADTLDQTQIPDQHSVSQTGFPAQIAAETNINKNMPPAPATSSKHNVKAIGRKGPIVPLLPRVAEEPSQLSDKPLDNANPTNQSIDTNVPQFKPRKSLMTFTSYSSEPAAEKKKKRRMLGVGKTLFDEEDDGDTLTANPIPGRGMLAARTLNKGKKQVILGAKVTDPSGFQFSPLKKDRRVGRS